MYGAVVVTLAYLRKNRTQADLGETYGVSRSTVSRAVAAITALLAQVGQYAPTANQALVPGRSYLVDGTLLPSFLMDTETLLAHRDRWVREDTPTRAALDRLTPEEKAVYTDLVTDRYGDRVRLEQERIDWAWVCDRLPDGMVPDGPPG